MTLCQAAHRFFLFEAYMWPWRPGIPESIANLFSSSDIHPLQVKLSVSLVPFLYTSMVQPFANEIFLVTWNPKMLCEGFEVWTLPNRLRSGLSYKVMLGTASPLTSWQRIKPLLTPSYKHQRSIITLLVFELGCTKSSSHTDWMFRRGFASTVKES